MSKRYTTHYIKNQHQRMEYRFWIGDKVYQVDEDCIKEKQDMGFKVERLVNGQWEEVK